MPGINEAASQSQLYGALIDGKDTLDLSQEVNFQAYTRVVLPLDRYIFWSPTVQFCVSGALHYSQEIRQASDETYGAAVPVFTSSTKVAQFSESPINTIFVASVAGIRYAFSAQQGFFSAANLWHYTGNSVPPAFAAQLLDDPGSIDPKQAVTDNSLALWLGLNNYPALYPDFFSNDIPLYPAFMVPPNLEPQYGVIDISDDSPVSEQSAPYLDAQGSHWQLCKDRVKVTLYGLQHNAAIDFQDCVNQYSLITGNFGITNIPVVRDVKRPFAEMQTIAMKKEITYEVSYNQVRVRQVARQLIESAPVTYIFR